MPAAAARRWPPGRPKSQQLDGRVAGAGSGQRRRPTASWTRPTRSFRKAAAAREAAEKARGEAKKASDDVSAALAAAIKDVAAKEDILKALVEARDKAQAAVAKLPDDKPLAEAAGAVQDPGQRSRHATGRGAQDGRRKDGRKCRPRRSSWPKPTRRSQAAAGRSDASPARRSTRPTPRSARRSNRFRAAKAGQAELTARIADAQAALDCQALAAAAADASQAAAQAASEQLRRRQSRRPRPPPSNWPRAEAAAKAAAEKAAADRAGADAAVDARWSIARRPASRWRRSSRCRPSNWPGPRCRRSAWSMQQRAALRRASQERRRSDGRSSRPRRAPPPKQRLLEERVDEKLRGNIGRVRVAVRSAAGAGRRVSGHRAPGAVSGQRRSAGRLAQSGRKQPDRAAGEDRRPQRPWPTSCT